MSRRRTPIRRVHEKPMGECKALPIAPSGRERFGDRPTLSAWRGIQRWFFFWDGFGRRWGVLGGVLGINGVADFHGPRLDVGGGELAKRFASGEEIGAAFFGSSGGENGVWADRLAAVSLDQDEALAFRNRGDSTDESGCFGNRCGGGLPRICGFESVTRRCSHQGDSGKTKAHTGFHKWMESIEDAHFVGLDETLQSALGSQEEFATLSDALDDSLFESAGCGE